MTSLEELNKNISVDLTDYNDCIDVIEHEYCINGINAQIRMHYIKFDGNGFPMIKALAKMLYTCNPPEKQQCSKVEFSISYMQGDSA